MGGFRSVAEEQNIFVPRALTSHSIPTALGHNTRIQTAARTRTPPLQLQQKFMINSLRNHSWCMRIDCSDDDPHSSPPIGSDVSDKFILVSVGGACRNTGGEKTDHVSLRYCCALAPHLHSEQLHERGCTGHVLASGTFITVMFITARTG